MIIIKEKHHLEDLYCRKLTVNMRWQLQRKSHNEQVSPPATKWCDQHVLPPLVVNETALYCRLLL